MSAPETVITICLDVISKALHQVAVEYYEGRTRPEFLEWLGQGEEWVAEGREKFGSS